MIQCDQVLYLQQVSVEERDVEGNRVYSWFSSCCVIYFCVSQIYEVSIDIVHVERSLKHERGICTIPNTLARLATVWDLVAPIRHLIVMWYLVFLLLSKLLLLFFYRVCTYNVVHFTMGLAVHIVQQTFGHHI